MPKHLFIMQWNKNVLRPGNYKVQYVSCDLVSRSENMKISLSSMRQVCKNKLSRIFIMQIKLQSLCALPGYCINIIESCICNMSIQIYSVHLETLHFSKKTKINGLHSPNLGHWVVVAPTFHISQVIRRICTKWSSVNADYPLTIYRRWLAMATVSPDCQICICAPFSTYDLAHVKVLQQERLFPAPNRS